LNPLQNGVNCKALTVCACCLSSTKPISNVHIAHLKATTSNIILDLWCYCLDMI